MKPFAMLFMVVMWVIAAFSIWLAVESYTTYQDLNHYEATRCARSKSGCD